MRRELVALEVVEAIGLSSQKRGSTGPRGLELHGEGAAGPLEVPLRARAVAQEQRLHGRELVREGRLRARVIHD